MITIPTTLTEKLCGETFGKIDHRSMAALRPKIPTALCRLPGLRRFAAFGRQQEAALEIRDRHRAAEKVALALFASQAKQEIRGRPILDAFRDHRQAELLAEADSRTDDGGIVGVGKQVPDKGPVHFEAVEREF